MRISATRDEWCSLANAIGRRMLDLQDLVENGEAIAGEAQTELDHLRSLDTKIAQALA